MYLSLEERIDLKRHREAKTDLQCQRVDKQVGDIVLSVYMYLRSNGTAFSVFRLLLFLHGSTTEHENS